jgi:hypothetical protein
VPPKPTTLALTTLVNGQETTNGTYASSVTLVAEVREQGSGNPVPGKTVQFGLGAQRAQAITDESGSAKASIQIFGSPGNVLAQATVLGTDTTASSSDGAMLTIGKQPAVINVELLTKAGVSDAIAFVTDSLGHPLGEESVLLVVTMGGKVIHAIPVVTDSIGRAALGPIPIPAPQPGQQEVAYNVSAMIAGSVEMPNGETISLDNDRYQGTTNQQEVVNQLLPAPKVEYTGEKLVSEGSDLHLQAKITSTTPGAPLNLAMAVFSVYGSNDTLIGSVIVPVGEDGTASAIMPDVPPGDYTIKTTTGGAAFAPPAQPSVTEATALTEEDTNTQRIEDLKARSRPGDVQLTWKHIDGAYQYHVYRRIKNGSETEWGRVASTKSTYSTYLDRWLHGNVIYEYYVAPADADGKELGSSNTVTITTRGRGQSSPQGLESKD